MGTMNRRATVLGRSGRVAESVFDFAEFACPQPAEGGTPAPVQRKPEDLAKIRAGCERGRLALSAFANDLRFLSRSRAEFGVRG
ncbi:MAG: hypothetical protein DME26_17965 [Verrucomicrobia bacterium]|nr:MAG: hypothetical protein DME26_17965 [Verrucomicrobiota bacterium]